MEGMIKRYALTESYDISRVIKGGWQLSDGHSDAISSDPVADMFAFVERGIDTFDCADIYTGVEAIIGKFVAANKARRDPLPIRVHTKYVPDYDQLGKLKKSDVEAIIDRSLQRLKLERLDMVQFHWWNYAIAGAVEAAVWLRELHQAGKIELLSLTNFNTERTREILDAGVPLSTTQVQYSLLDPRPEKALLSLCAAHDMHLLCYGTLAGGFLSNRWLGQPEPESFSNRSLIKYKLMIDEIGGWDLFQTLLESLDRIARKHGVSIASVASNWVLEQARVAAVIIGSRNADHVDRYKEVFALQMDDEDRDAILAVKGQMQVPADDVFDLERDKNGRHGSIMKYNLNAE
ncbi:aldo/keto reductase [Congregibacter litoralis]|uniref:Putative oxidoreductase n=1 Tax=Congregibacter litoralis KT71 TaxID=314285 RepID=A4ABU8_9GAMM|nr:aldo/keto reductase [Congregibacter litoralis]EAQ96611.1 putative oxidoreductase [Congregibacter litoralis KT71]